MPGRLRRNPQFTYREAAELLNASPAAVRPQSDEAQPMSGRARPADSDEAGHRFRFEADQGSDLMSATWRLLLRIEVMMFCPEQLVKRAWIWISAKARVAVGNGGRSALSIAP